MAEEEKGIVDKGITTLEQALAEIDRVQRLRIIAEQEAKEFRLKLKEFDKNKDAGTDTQEALIQAQLERDEALATLKQHKIHSAVVAKAAELGFAHPEDAIALADLSQAEVGEDGKIAGFEKSLEALAKAKPYLIGQVGAGLGTPRKTGATTTSEKVEQARPKIRL